MAYVALNSLLVLQACTFRFLICYNRNHLTYLTGLLKELCSICIQGIVNDEKDLIETILPYYILNVLLLLP